MPKPKITKSKTSTTSTTSKRRSRSDMMDCINRNEPCNAKIMIPTNKKKSPLIIPDKLNGGRKRKTSKRKTSKRKHRKTKR
jgi:hypothetical protein